MLQKVAVGRWSLDAYDGIAPAPILKELRSMRTHLPARASSTSTRPLTVAAYLSSCDRASRYSAI